MNQTSAYFPQRSPSDTEAGDLALAWATDALQDIIRHATEHGQGDQSVPLRTLAEAAVLESHGLAHEDAEALVTEVERRIEGLFRMVGTA